MHIVQQLIYYSSTAAAATAAPATTNNNKDCQDKEEVLGVDVHTVILMGEGNLIKPQCTSMYIYCLCCAFIVLFDWVRDVRIILCTQ